MKSVPLSSRNSVELTVTLPFSQHNLPPYGVSVNFLHPAWGDKQGFVSRDGKQKDDPIQARMQQGELGVEQ